MALTKTTVPINFNNGLDTKSDNKQVEIGKFLTLQNSVFDVTGRLTKRNGYPKITELPNSDQTTLTTLNNTLLATGSHLYAFSEPTNQWFQKGSIQPVQLSVQSLVRSSTGQTTADIAVSDTGLACLAFIDASAGYYVITDTTTGQQVVARTALPASATNPRTFVLGRYFIITFLATVAAAPHLQYIAIPIANPSTPRTAADISTNVSSLTAGYDAVVTNNSLYLAWNNSSSDVRITFLSSTLVVNTAVNLTTAAADLMSVTADAANSRIYATWWDSAGQDGYTASFSTNLVQVLSPTVIFAGKVISEITTVCENGLLTVFYQNTNNYNTTGAYPNTVRTDYITKNTVTAAGVVGTPAIILRSVGLASKAFTDADGNIYLIAAYGETNQPTYFLIDSSGSIYMRLAYANAGGYASTQVLPTVNVIDNTYYFPYLIKDFLATVNKGTALPTGTPVNTIYTQTGVNLATFTINDEGQYSSEIASALHLTGGQLWEYDGVKPVEHGFHVWPENVASTTATGSGGLVAQSYYYVFCYEWTDNQGNLHRSAPSIPLKQTTTTASSTNTLYIPTLRLTYKITPNPVRIVGYRYSTAQPVYYQFTSITSPTANSTTVDYVTITDAAADSAILGQTLLYTTGGVIENIAAPASIHSTMFKNRLFLIDAEDQNLLWYSKQVIQNTPVEMSDLLTIYVAPSTGAQGSTGPMTAIAAMDDKLIIFKRSGIYYETGIGPDVTGANNDFTDPVYVTSPVGCINPNSIVLMPNGLMFQSEKGLWLLGRDLNTTYIGAPVEAFNGYTVRSATAIPDTTQVRLVLENNITLMYDYYRDQWGVFTNTAAISATLFNRKHTYLNSFGQVLQETPGSYVDGSRPVLLSFTTSWISLAGLQGYERFYYLHLLGTYKSPFKLNAQIAYDFNPNPTQATLILPDNYTANWGDEALWGSGGSWGGSEGNVFTARLFPERQKCDSFQLTITEVYDPAYGVAPGEGLNLSGLALTIGVKKATRTSRAGKSFG